MSGGNASSGLGLLNVFHELKVHIKGVGVPNWKKEKKEKEDSECKQ